MSDSQSPSTGITPDKINTHSSAEVKEWAKTFNVTESQILDAVAAVGDLATEVEMHLKGTRSTTNNERVDEVGS